MASSGRPRAKVLHSYKGKSSFTLFFRPTRARGSSPANANNSTLARALPPSPKVLSGCQSVSIPATKDHQGGLGDSEDESDAKVGSVLGSETGQQSAPHIQLLEIPRLSQDRNAERVLFQNNFGTTSVSHGDQSFLQYFYNGNVQLHNYSSRRVKLERFSNFAAKGVYPLFDRRSLNYTWL